MKKKIFFSIILSLFLFSFVIWQTKEIAVKVLGLWLIIWTPNNFSLGTVSQWNTIELDFSDHFWVEDLRWSNTGYYTTIQCDWLYWPNNFIITWILLSWSHVELLNWYPNTTLIYSNLNAWIDVTSPKLYLYKNDNVVNNIIWNKYWNKPSIKINVPVDAPAGTYTWKITYTFYDTSFNY